MAGQDMVCGSVESCVESATLEVLEPELRNWLRRQADVHK
jgi:hypothetical protein